VSVEPRPEPPGARVDEEEREADDDRRKRRSTSAFRTAFPRNGCRTRTSAHATPKIVFRGTAMSAIRSVSQSACRKSGSVIALQTGSRPCWKVR
jgi:hypothetical protein